MKNMLCVSLLLLFVSLTLPVSGQNIKKDNLLGIHLLDIELKPGVTMEQVADYYENTFFPTVNKQAKGVAKGYLVKGRRGEAVDRLATMWVFPSEAARSKYFNEDGSLTAAGKLTAEVMDALNTDLEKLATITYSEGFTDWVVQ